MESLVGFFTTPCDYFLTALDSTFPAFPQFLQPFSLCAPESAGVSPLCVRELPIPGKCTFPENAARGGPQAVSTLSCFVTESQLLQAQSQFLQRSLWREQGGRPSVVVSGVVFTERCTVAGGHCSGSCSADVRVQATVPALPPSTSLHLPPPPGPPFIRFPRSAGEAPSAPGHPQLPRLYEPPSPSPRTRHHHNHPCLISE